MIVLHITILLELLNFSFTLGPTYKKRKKVKFFIPCTLFQWFCFYLFRVYTLFSTWLILALIRDAIDVTFDELCTWHMDIDLLLTFFFLFHPICVCVYVSVFNFNSLLYSTEFGTLYYINHPVLVTYILY